MVRTKSRNGMRRTRFRKRVKAHRSNYANGHANGERVALSRLYDIPMADRPPGMDGQKPLYRPQFAPYARHLCKFGATDMDLANAFGVAITTIEFWMAQHQEFYEATRIGKGEYDEQVVRRLAMKAMGYSYEAEEIFCHQGQVTRVPTVKHVPPDTTAAIFWLKNRQRGLWRDKYDHEHTGDVTIKSEVGNLSDEQIAQIESIIQSATSSTDEAASGSASDRAQAGEGEEETGGGTGAGDRWTNSFH